MTMIEERKSFPSLSRRNTRTKINENISTRQHSLRSCRIVEPSYKTVRNQTKRSNSSSIPTTFPMITCANISLQRKLYKQILIAESDGNFNRLLRCFVSLRLCFFSRWLWSFSWFTYCISWRFNCGIYWGNYF
jgi:hypothetical protein